MRSWLDGKVADVKLTYRSGAEILNATSQYGTISEAHGNVTRCRQKHGYKLHLAADDVIRH